MARWFSTVSLIAALMLGYTFLLSEDRNNIVTVTHTEIADYAITDAEVIETGIDGFTHVRLTATDASLGYNSNALSLHNLRIDYQPSKSEPGKSAPRSGSNKPTASRALANTHWVARADNGTRTPRDDIITLTGNVSVTNAGAATPMMLTTQAINLDLTKQVATNSEKTQVALGQHVVTGNKLRLDLPTQQLHLRNGGQVRLAANTLPAEIKAGTATPKISAPDVFEYDELDFRGDVLHFTKVRSKTPPYIRAAEATARGDLGNNEVELYNGVEFELPQQGNLVADSAVVTIRDGHVVFAKVLASNGQMIVFEHHPAGAKAGDAIAIKGRAVSIDYDLDANTLLMRSGRLSRTVNGEAEFDMECPIGNYNVATGNGGCRKVDAKRPTTTIHIPKDSLPNKLPGQLPGQLLGKP